MTRCNRGINVGEIEPWYAFVSGLVRLITYFYPLLVNSSILNSTNSYLATLRMNYMITITSSFQAMAGLQRYP